MKFKVSGLRFKVSGWLNQPRKYSAFGWCFFHQPRTCVPNILITLITSITLITMTTSCGSDQQTKEFAEKQSHLSDNLVSAHKQFVKDESKEIDDFIKRHNYEMQKSATGLRYKIDSDNKGEKPQRGDVVILKYDIYLLDGKLCYSSDSVGLMTFTVEQDDVPNGIHEAVQLMRKGDKAQLIIPAHLAYGLTGDNDKIPSESTLYCTLQLNDIKKKSK